MNKLRMLGRAFFTLRNDNQGFLLRTPFFGFATVPKSAGQEKGFIIFLGPSIRSVLAKGPIYAHSFNVEYQSGWRQEIAKECLVARARFRA